MSEEKREPQPSAAQFADSARVWALPVRDALAMRRLRIRLKHVYTQLGKAVYEKHGEQSGATELVSPIANAHTRLAFLDADIRRLSEYPPGQVLTPKRIALCEIAGLAILLVVVVAILANGCLDKGSARSATNASSPANEASAEKGGQEEKHQAGQGSATRDTVASADVETYFRESKRQREEVTNAYRDRIAYISHHHPTLGRSHRPLNNEETQRYKSHLEEEMKREESVMSCLLMGPIQVGALGLVPEPISIEQRIDGNSALAKIEIPKGSPPRYTAVAGGISRTMTEETVFLQGVDLSNAVDGKRFQLEWIMKITGTKTYGTAAGGTNTVYVLEPLDEETHKKILERIEARKAAAH